VRQFVYLQELNRDVRLKKQKMPIFSPQIGGFEHTGPQIRRPKFTSFTIYNLQHRTVL
jgi:hypothetical protein